MEYNKEGLCMMKASDSDDKAVASKEAAAVKAGQTMRDSTKKKQVSEKAKGSADKAAQKKRLRAKIQ
jgi:hypothetical protein